MLRWRYSLLQLTAIGLISLAAYLFRLKLVTLITLGNDTVRTLISLLWPITSLIVGLGLSSLLASIEGITQSNRWLFSFAIAAALLPVAPGQPLLWLCLVLAVPLIHWSLSLRAHHQRRELYFPADLLAGGGKILLWILLILMSLGLGSVAAEQIQSGKINLSPLIAEQVAGYTDHQSVVQIEELIDRQITELGIILPVSGVLIVVAAFIIMSPIISWLLVAAAYAIEYLLTATRWLKVSERPIKQQFAELTE